MGTRDADKRVLQPNCQQEAAANPLRNASGEIPGASLARSPPPLLLKTNLCERQEDSQEASQVTAGCAEAHRNAPATSWALLTRGSLPVQKPRRGFAHQRSTRGDTKPTSLLTAASVNGMHTRPGSFTSHRCRAPFSRTPDTLRSRARWLHGPSAARPRGRLNRRGRVLLPLPAPGAHGTHAGPRECTLGSDGHCRPGGVKGRGFKLTSRGGCGRWPRLRSGEALEKHRDQESRRRGLHGGPRKPLNMMCCSSWAGVPVERVLGANRRGPWASLGLREQSGEGVNSTEASGAGPQGSEPAEEPSPSSLSPDGGQPGTSLRFECRPPAGPRRHVSGSFGSARPLGPVLGSLQFFYLYLPTSSDAQ